MTLSTEFKSIANFNLPYKVRKELIVERIKEKPAEMAKMIMEVKKAVRI